MGTKEHQTTLKASAAAAAVNSPTEATTKSAICAANNHSSFTSDSGSRNSKSVANNANRGGNQTANTNSSVITLNTITTTTPHHAKAQVIIIPATPASTVATNAAKKIRRAFSMPRNPFQWSRKFKTSSAIGTAETPGGSGGGGSNSALTACVGGGRNSGRHGSIVSLNSYKAVSKETDVAADASATSNPTSQRQEKKISNTPGSNAGGGGARVFRRSSLRKFINRIAQHVSTSVNMGANKHATSQANSLSSSDRVPPIGGYQWPADQTPGVTGLKNHGNTCFMNAVLQCLSHTDILAEYFVLDQYKSDLKRRNKINSRKFGTKGELTEQLANVLKALWTCKNETDHSTSFKAVVDRYGSQFRSSTQHDAQEFLFWLLDKVHEDLNTATKRRYKSVKNSYGRPDEVIAAETLANHIRCNNSFVQAVFQAQFRSSLTCPRCKKQSNTFDPFHCISVQLPQLTQQTIFVTVLYHKQHPRQVKLGLTVPAGSPIVALREQLHADTGIANERMVLVDINETGFSRVYYDTQPVSTLAGVDTIYCIEVPPENVKKATSVSDAKSSSEAITSTTTTTTTKNTAGNLQASTELLLLVANMRKRKKPQSDEELGSEFVEVIERFGTPFSLRVPRDVTYVELQKKLMREISALLKPEVFATTTPLSNIFKIRLQDPSADPDTYLELVEHPLLTEMIDLALSVLSAEAGPAHIKVLLEWSEPESHFSDISTMQPLVEHESVARLLEKRSQDTAALTLEQCLEHYTKAETLSAEDAWRCPHCQQYLPVVKTLGLWSLPDILVVHFKRFRQHQAKGSNAAKLTTMVKFPLNAFDMAPHLAKGMREQLSDSTFSSTTGHHHNRPSPWKKSSRATDSRSSTLESNKRETRYDLYAVCYHQGDTLETGHYTAACKNPYDHHWYKFDDQRVSRVPSDSIEQDIINNEAYMLFYQRRRSEMAECSGSSSTSGEHWISKIAPPMQSQSGEKVIAVPTTSSVIASAAMATKVEQFPEKVETKPVEIPKVEGALSNRVISDDAVDLTPAPKKETFTQIVVPEKEKHVDIVNTEGIKYADDGAEDADIDELDVLETLPFITGSPPTEDDVNHIFVMDEDCKLNEENDNSKNENNSSKAAAVVTNQQPVIATVSPVKTKSPLLIATVNTETALSSELKTSASITLTNGNKCSTPKQNNRTSAAVSEAGSVSSSSNSLSSRSSPHSLAASTFGASTLQSKFNGFSASSSANQYKESSSLLSSSLKSNSSSIIAAAAAAHANDLALNHRHQTQQHYWHGSRSSVSAIENVTSTLSNSQQAPHHTHCLNLRHSFSTSSNYKLKECSDTLSSMLRNSANTCSKDTLIFIDQQTHHHRHHHHHSLMEDDDDTFMGSRSLWISPVTPHKLITVSPKN